MGIKETLLNQLKELGNTDKKVSIEHLRLFIEDEKQNRITLGEDPFQCYVLAEDFLKTFLTPLLEANFAETRRFQLIVNSGGHYLTLDILWGTQVKKCLLLDAANDPRMYSVYSILNGFPFDRIFVASGKYDPAGGSNNLQRDFDSCSIFSFDHAVQISKIQIYSQLEQLEGKDAKKLIVVSWMQLPMQLVWNAQSLKFLDAYLAEKKVHFSQDELMKYRKYLEANTKPDYNGKDRNIAADNIFSALLKRSILRIESLGESQIGFIIAEVSHYPISECHFIRQRVDSNLKGSSVFFRAQQSVAEKNRDSMNLELPINSKKC